MEEETLAERLQRMSEDHLPAPRLVIASATPACKRNFMIDHTSAISLGTQMNGSDVIGVIQRTQDVDTTIQIPFSNLALASDDEESDDDPAGEEQSSWLKCDIYYDPSGDGCTLVNNSEAFDLLFLTQQTDMDRYRCALRRGRKQHLDPGLWRIGYALEGPEQPLLYLLVCERRFQMAISARSSRSSQRSQDTRTIIPGGTRELTLWTIRYENPLQVVKNGQTVVVTTPDQPLSPHEQQSPATNSYALKRTSWVGDTANSTLFACVHSVLNDSKVVAKVSKSGDRTDEEIVRCANLWKSEQRPLSRLKHRNIVSLLGYDARLFALYLERLPQSLETDCSLMSQQDFQDIILQMSSALTYLAENKIAHNDVKPSNIAYSRERGAVLFDFGLATSSEGYGTPGGTSCYVPPEYTETGKRGTAGDVWALGVTMLYVMSKIGLPEDQPQRWSMFDARIVGSQPWLQLHQWLERLRIQRDLLDRDDMTELWIYNMLRFTVQKRCTAAEAEEALVAAFVLEDNSD